MKLHLPKGLLTALLSALLVVPGKAVTVTVGDYTGTFDSVTTGNSIPSSPTPALWVTGDRLQVGADYGNLNANAGTVILGSGTKDGDNITATQLFLQGWRAGVAIDVTSKLIIGGNSGDAQAAVRFGADGGYDVKVSGDIIVADNAKIIAGGTHAIISGNITGENKTLTLTNFISAATYNLAGATGKSITLGGLTVSGTTTVSLAYDQVKINTLFLGGASGSLTISSPKAELGNLYSPDSSSLAISTGAKVTLSGQSVFAAIANEGELVVADGAEITLPNTTLSKESTRTKTQGNGFGLMTGLTDAEITALKGAAVTGSGAVTWTGTQSWGCLDTYYIYNAVTAVDLDMLTKAKKSVYVGENAGLVKLTTNVTEGIDVTVCSGSTWDINGMADKCYTVTLNGGTLTNTGNAVDTQHKQIMGITLTANSDIDGSADHCLLNAKWTATTLNLGGHTLTKKGECTFAIVNSTIYGGGVLRIEEGTLAFEQGITLGSEQDTEDTVIWLAGGDYSTWGLPDTGFVLAHDAELKVGGESTGQEVVWAPKFTIGDNNLKFTTVGDDDVLKIMGDITGSGELVFSGKNIELAGTVTGDSKLSVLAGANLTVTGNLTIGATIENAGTFTLDGANGGKLTFTSKDDLTPGGPNDVVYRDPILSQTVQQSTQNGYAEGTFIIIKNGTDASATGITEIYITGEDDPFTGSDIVGDANGVKIVGTKAMKGLYYVNSDTFKYGEKNSDGTDANAAASAATTGVVLNVNGKKLIMLTDLAKNAANQDGIILVKDPTAAAGTSTSKMICVKDGVTLNNVALNVQDGIALKMQRYDETEGERNGEDIIMKQLTGNGTLVAGSGILVKESGSFTGSYDGIVRLGTASEDAIQELRADAKLTVIGTAGTVKLTGLTDTAVGASNVLGGIDSKGVSVNLGNLNVADDGTLTPTTVTLERESSMDRGVLEFAVSIEDVNDNLYETKTDKPLVTRGKALNLSNVTLKIQEVNYMGVEYNAAGPETDILLFVLSDAQDSSATNVSFDMSESKWLNKYFTNFRVEKGSINVVADANTGIYAAHGQTPNGIAGLGLAGKAMFRLNPQTKTPDSELAQVLNLLDDHNNAGNEAAMDRLGAALAGSSLPAVGMALADDVQRQLRSIRNRTTTMGVNQCEVNEDMPYINGWISGDGSYSQLSASSTDSGYQVSSWGGTVGVDVDVNPNLTLGVAVSALFGDYTGKAEDVLKGDLDTQYVSLFARVSTGSWVNTFVGTLGRADVDLERTIPGVAGKTTYKTNGMMFGFLYEVARTFALNADATTCVQPLFNMSFSHTTLDSATEGGTADTRLTTDSASLTQFSLGLGGRLQSIVGENEYNRASIFEARALLKLDFGDRYNKLNTALAALPTATVSTRSNEKGVIGAEVGATLTIPISQDAGSIFFDVNADFRADQTGVNGSIGYRVNF